MPVYVDRMEVERGGKVFTAHMIADTHEELMHMAYLLGLWKQWLQKPGTPLEHFDLVETKRAKAVEFGAIELTPREMGMILRGKVQRDEQARAVEADGGPRAGGGDDAGGADS